MKKMRYKVALLKRKYHIWQRARIERKLSRLRKRLLDIVAEEANHDTIRP